MGSGLTYPSGTPPRRRNIRWSRHPQGRSSPHSACAIGVAVGKVFTSDPSHGSHVVECEVCGARGRVTIWASIFNAGNPEYEIIWVTGEDCPATLGRVHRPKPVPR